MIQRLATLIGCPQPDCIYEIIADFQLDLCLDVGAAAGKTARSICLAGGNGTRLLAFEPFLGNHKYFRETTSDLPNDIQLLAMALSDKIGESRFNLPSIVDAQTPGWGGYDGYSSVGHLEEPTSPLSLRSLQRRLATLARKAARPFSSSKHNRTITITVPTTTMDAIVPDGVIDFVKIDVQGAEAKVLRGASRALSSERIRLMYIEWAGDPEVIRLLSEKNYRIFDSLYVAGPRTSDPRPFEEIGFKILGKLNLSTGLPGFEMTLADTSVSPAEAMQRVRAKKLGWIQTDLIAVSPSAETDFLRATDSYRRKQ